MAQEDIGGTEQTSLDQEFRDAFTKSGLETEADLDNDVRQHGPALINRYLKEADARLDETPNWNSKRWCAKSKLCRRAKMSTCRR